MAQSYRTRTLSRDSSRYGEPPKNPCPAEVRRVPAARTRRCHTSAVRYLIGRKLSQKSIANILQTIFAILNHAATCKMPVCKVGLENLKLGGVGAKPAPYFTPNH